MGHPVGQQYLQIRTTRYGQTKDGEGQKTRGEWGIDWKGQGRESEKRSVIGLLYIRSSTLKILLAEDNVLDLCLAKNFNRRKKTNSIFVPNVCIFDDTNVLFCLFFSYYVNENKIRSSSIRFFVLHRTFTTLRHNKQNTDGFLRWLSICESQIIVCEMSVLSSLVGTFLYFVHAFSYKDLN